MPAANPAAAPPPGGTSAPRTTPTGRLGQGELRRLIAAHLAASPGAHTPGEIARALGKSAGAVGNALTTLAAPGRGRPRARHAHPLPRHPGHRRRCRRPAPRTRARAPRPPPPARPAAGPAPPRARRLPGRGPLGGDPPRRPGLPATCPG